MRDVRPLRLRYWWAGELGLMVRLAGLAAAGALPGLGPRPVQRGEPGPHPGYDSLVTAAPGGLNMATATGFAMNAVCEQSMR